MCCLPLPCPQRCHRQCVVFLSFAILSFAISDVIISVLSYSPFPLVMSLPVCCLPLPCPQWCHHQCVVFLSLALSDVIISVLSYSPFPLVMSSYAMPQLLSWSILKRYVFPFSLQLYMLELFEQMKCKTCALERRLPQHLISEQLSRLSTNAQSWKLSEATFRIITNSA